MTNQMDPSDQTIKGLYAPQNPRIGEFMPGQDLGPALRATRPTLGFGSQASRIARAKGEYMYAGPSTAQTNPFSSAPYDTFQYQRLGSGQPSTTYPYQERRPSNRSRPRGQMRKKRTDQGPEPSVADIYPDDAHWAPTQPIHRGYFAPPPPVPLRPQPILYAERPAQWPTPAEVYTQGRQLPRQAPVAQVFNIFEGHYAPTEEDISDADGDVVALIDQLPNPSVHTLMCFSQASLTPDARPLTPEQEIGERYGLTCQGAGSGEAWSPPAVPGTELFSARW
ncbi:hypothetical protein GQ44DRAFT_711663 [Phaeosphaeriaceae sp. PMI808]|nr:hypothetical protein GQ44DRAFT_711663 [Phaeosphaeriaceae sp. PMI808]